MSKVVDVVLGAALIAVGIILPEVGVIAWSTAISIMASGALFVVSAFTRPSLNVDGPRVASQSPDAPRVIIYGQAMVGGTITYIAATGDGGNRLHLVITLAAHQCQSIDAILFDNYTLQLQRGLDLNSGQEVLLEVGQYANHVYVEEKLGAPGEPAFPALIAETAGLGTGAIGWQADHSYSVGDLIVEAGIIQACVTAGTSYSSPPTWDNNLDEYTYELPPSTVSWICLGPQTGGLGASAWTPAHRQDGCCSIHVMMVYKQYLFSNGVPNIRALVSGKLCVDPRTGIKAWTQNPAVCIRDFLLDPKFGYRCFTNDEGVTSPEINDASFIAAANLCDESVSSAGPSGLFGPYSALNSYTAWGYFNPTTRTLYWINSIQQQGGVGCQTGGGPPGLYTWFQVTFNVLAPNLPLQQLTTDFFPGGYDASPSGQFFFTPDNIFVGVASGYGGFRWVMLSLSGGYIKAVGALDFGDDDTCGGSTWLGQLLAAVWTPELGIVHISAGGAVFCVLGPNLGTGTLPNTTGGVTAAACVDASGNVWVLSNGDFGPVLSKIAASGESITITNYTLGADTDSVNDIEYNAGDNTLLYWIGDTLFKWDIATTALVNSAAVTYEISGPIAGGLLPNGLNFYDPVTLVQSSIVASATGLPSWLSAIAFKHWYDPLGPTLWLQVDVVGPYPPVYGTAVGSGSEAQYGLNGWFDTSKALGDVLQNLLSSCAGKVSWISGQWNLFPGAWRPPALPPFTDDDLAGAVQMQAKLGRRDVYTGVKGQYVEPNNNWQPTDFPPLVQSSYVALQNGTCQTPNDRGNWATGVEYSPNDTVMSFGYAYVCTVANLSSPETQPGLGADWEEDWIFAGEIIWKDVQYPFTTSGTTAQQLASYDLQWGQRQITASWPLKLTGYQSIPSDVIEVTRATFGWTAKPFEVTSVKLDISDSGGADAAAPVLTAVLNLHETDEDVWAAYDALPVVSQQQPVVTGPQYVFDSGGDVVTLDPEG
jgi:hypothetical protein